MLPAPLLLPAPGLASLPPQPHSAKDWKVSNTREAVFMVVWSHTAGCEFLRVIS